MENHIRTYRIQDEAHIRTVGVHVDAGTVTRDFPLHNHDFYETFVIVSGTGTHVLGDWEYPLSRGDVFSIKGDEMHGFRNVQNLQIINLMYDPAILQHSNPELRSIPGFDPMFLIEPEIRLVRDFGPMLKLDDRMLDYVVNLRDFLTDLLNRNQQAFYPVIRQTFLALLGYLAVQYDAGSNKNIPVSQLSRALAFMEQNLASPIRLPEIARQVYLSPRQLERLFEEYFEESPMKHLQKMRMEHAMTLLQSPDTAVSAAALASGFQDPSYFTRIFRETYGISPKKVQKFVLNSK